MPLYSVERKGFQKMIEALNPEYSVSSRRFFTDCVMNELYHKTQGTVKATLNETDQFSFTMDMWIAKELEIGTWSMGDSRSKRELIKKSIHSCPPLNSMLKVIHWSGEGSMPDAFPCHQQHENIWAFQQPASLQNISLGVWTDCKLPAKMAAYG